jgi:hypothetical protein
MGFAVLADQRDNGRGSQHVVSQPLEPRRVDTRADGQSFGQRRDDVVTSEARPPARETLRAQEISDELFDAARRHFGSVARLTTSARSALCQPISAARRRQPSRSSGGPRRPRFARRVASAANSDARGPLTPRVSSAADLGAPATEQPGHVGGDAGEFGDAIAHGLPLDAQRPSELAVQDRLVDPARRRGVPV